LRLAGQDPTQVDTAKSFAMTKQITEKETNVDWDEEEESPSPGTKQEIASLAAKENVFKKIKLKRKY
jgi:hypothetical protein